jgi:hypothetical protein
MKRRCDGELPPRDNQICVTSKVSNTLPQFKSVMNEAFLLAQFTKVTAELGQTPRRVPPLLFEWRLFECLSNHICESSSVHWTQT